MSSCVRLEAILGGEKHCVEGLLQVRGVGDVDARIGGGPNGGVAAVEADDGGAEGARFADDGGRGFGVGGMEQHVGGGDVCQRNIPRPCAEEGCTNAAACGARQ